jgi:hypothetical protein
VFCAKVWLWILRCPAYIHHAHPHRKCQLQTGRAPGAAAPDISTFLLCFVIDRYAGLLQAVEYNSVERRPPGPSVSPRVKRGRNSLLRVDYCRLCSVHRPTCGSGLECSSTCSDGLFGRGWLSPRLKCPLRRILDWMKQCLHALRDISGRLLRLLYTQFQSFAATCRKPETCRTASPLISPKVKLSLNDLIRHRRELC